MRDKRKTIGVLISILDSFYQSDLWSGLRDQANELDYNVLFFCGMSFLSPIRTEIQDNAIYTLVSPSKIDAIITETGTLSNYIDLDAMGTFLERYKPLPIVSVSVEMKEHYSIVLDNRNSMKTMVLHLIETHGFTKIAMVTGPMTNVESRERLKGYTEALQTYEIPVTDDYIYHGNFNQLSGNSAILEFYKVRGIKPEAIVFSNDEMAIGGTLQLEMLGISVPSSVKITGFDDTENAKVFTVPLTTIKQPFYKMGVSAMKKVSEAINFENFVRTEAVEGQLILRESCGCNKVLPAYNEAQQALYEVFDTEVIYDFESFEEVIITNRKKISIILTKLINGQLIGGYLNEAFEKVLEGLIIDMHMKHTDGAFIKIFHKLMKRSILVDDIELDWQGFIYGFIITINKIQMILPLYKFMQEITHLTSVVVTSLSIRSDMHREYDYKNLYYRTSFLIQEMSSVKTKKEMSEIVLKTVEESKFKQYYICLFDDFIEVDSGHEINYPDDVNMIFGYEGGRVLEPLRFKTKEMMPDHMLYQDNRVDLAFFPLYYNNRHFGYLVADLVSVRRIIFKTLRELICNTLMQVVLHEELGSYKKQLKALSDIEDH